MYPHRRIISHLSVATVACFVTLGHTQASIYRCTNGKDPVLFSQFACPQGGESTLWKSSDTTLFVLPPLTKAEQDELAAMARVNTRKEKARQSQRRRQEKLRNTAAAKTRQQCREARTALATIRLQKKQGYKASAARALDREQARWDGVRRTTC
jgi:hypothetical protein